MCVVVCETCSIIYDTWIFPKCDSLLSNWKYYRNQTVTIPDDDSVNISSQAAASTERDVIRLQPVRGSELVHLHMQRQTERTG